MGAADDIEIRSAKGTAASRQEAKNSLALVLRAFLKWFEAGLRLFISKFPLDTI